MHPNPSFRKTETQRNITFAQERSFGVLSVNHDDGPLISHIPFQLSDNGSSLEAHLVRSNPIVRLLKEPKNAVIAVSGPDAYISPDWYEIDDQVPTWNYVAVHLRGRLQMLDHEKLHPILDRISANMEERLRPKTPWTSAKMTPEVYEKMQRQIVPVFMEISEIQGTWKLSQNKEQEVALRAADGVETSNRSIADPAIAALMRKANTE